MWEADQSAAEPGQGTQVQGTAEGHTFSRKDLDKMLNAAKTGIDQIIKAQKKALNNVECRM